MKYICIENNRITSVLDYEPNLPKGMTCFTLSDEEYEKSLSRGFKIDIESESVIQLDPNATYVDPKIAEEAYYFLSSTDWKVLRHIREKALGLETSLSEDEYIQLEEQRQEAASKI